MSPPPEHRRTESAPPGVPSRPEAGDPVVAALLRRCTFAVPGTAVTCAVSGGADSVALLALAVAAGLEVTAVHVEHGLRPDSGHEGALVAELARGWGAAAEVRRVEVAPGGDLEQRARTARHAALGPAALFGHTSDDRAETVLLRLLRGTGPTGLAALDPDRHPIMDLRRAETEALCDHLGVRPLHDPTNTDPRFTRNRVRHEVLPLLDDVARRDVVPLLCRLADLASEQADLLGELAGPLDPTDVAALRVAARPVAAAALRDWWVVTSGAEHPPDRAAVERMLAVVEGSARSCDVGGGWRLRRRSGRLRLVRDGPPSVR